MQKIIVKDNNINEALKKFSRVAAETRKVAKKHEYYLRPGLRMREKQKAALKLKNK